METETTVEELMEEFQKYCTKVIRKRIKSRDYLECDSHVCIKYNDCPAMRRINYWAIDHVYDKLISIYAKRGVDLRFQGYNCGSYVTISKIK